MTRKTELAIIAILLAAGLAVLVFRLFATDRPDCTESPSFFLRGTVHDC